MPIKKRNLLKPFLTTFLGAGGTGLCIAFAAFSYSAAMAGDMIFAAFLVFVAWIIASVGIVVTNQRGYLRFADDYQTKGKLIFIAFLAFFLLYGWEWQHQPLSPPKPPSAQEVADAVISSLPPLPKEDQAEIFKRQMLAGRISAKGNAIEGFKVNRERSMEIGDSGSVFKFVGRASDSLFNMFGKSELNVETVEGKVLVSTKVFDKAGRLVSEIIRNEWQSAPYPTSWDRNFDSNAFEVKNAEGDIVLQVKSLVDRIQIQGKWYDDKGNGVAFISKGYQKGAYILIKNSKKDAVTSSKIEPIFLYPSALHHGEKVALGRQRLWQRQRKAL